MGGAVAHRELEEDRSMADKHWQVSPDEAGTRLDRVLADRLGLSRRQVREALRLGYVRVGLHTAQERDRGRALEAGTQIEMIDDPAGLAELTPSPGLELVILAESPDWVAVDKPAGLPVHPLRSDEQFTALNAVRGLYPEMFGVGEGGLRSGVVHRLDVDTSGVQLFARTQVGFDRLRTAFREHRIRKVYRALVHGQPASAGQATLELEIRQHRPARVRVVESASPRSRACPLSWKVLERGPAHALVEVMPRTGFLHQVRVTMAHLGHPLLGDGVYGREDSATRHMLHAAALQFEDLDVTSPDPEDFAGLCRRWIAGSA